MKIKEIFNLAIEMGIAADFRGRDDIKRILERKKKNMKIFLREKKKFLIWKL